MAAQMATMAAMMQTMKIPDVKVVNLPSPPQLVGPLQPNDWLAKAHKYAQGNLIGPESMVVHNKYVYTGTSNGWVVELIPPYGQVRQIRRFSTPACGTSSADESSCGRPLGIRADNGGYLIVADSYNGIFRVNPTNGVYVHLVDSSVPVNGKPLNFINDVVVARDGTIFFTSSSSRYNRTDYLNIILEGDKSGRVLMYKPSAPGMPPNPVQELITNLHFANGLELSQDNSYLLVAEGGHAMIYKAWVGQNSPKRGQIEMCVNNLPGFVDNIRRSPRNTYWVGLSSFRSANKPSVLDTFGNKPEMREMLMRSKQEALQLIAHGLVGLVSLWQDRINSKQPMDWSALCHFGKTGSIPNSPWTDLPCVTLARQDQFQTANDVARYLPGTPRKRMPKEEVLKNAPKYGIALELNENCDIIRSLQDPEGRVFTSVSEIQEEDDILYIGSFDRPFIGTLNETLLPDPVVPSNQPIVQPNTQPSSGGTGSSGGDPTTANTGPGNSVSDPVQQLLERVRNNAKRFTKEQLEDLVVQLIHRLLYAAVENRRIQERTVRLQNDFNALQQMLSQTTQGEAPRAAAAATRPTGSGAGVTSQSTSNGTTVQAAGSGSTIATTVSAQTSNSTSFSGSNTG